MVIHHDYVKEDNGKIIYYMRCLNGLNYTPKVRKIFFNNSDVTRDGVGEVGKTVFQDSKCFGQIVNSINNWGQIVDGDLDTLQ